VAYIAAAAREELVSEGYYLVATGWELKFRDGGRKQMESKERKQPSSVKAFHGHS
jgi:hypothetical protein